MFEMPAFSWMKMFEIPLKFLGWGWGAYWQLVVIRPDIGLPSSRWQAIICTDDDQVIWRHTFASVVPFFSRVESHDCCTPAGHVWNQWGLVSSMCNRKLWDHWLMWWLAAWSAPSHKLNPYLLLIGPLGRTSVKLNRKKEYFLFAKTH